MCVCTTAHHVRRPARIYEQTHLHAYRLTLTRLTSPLTPTHQQTTNTGYAILHKYGGAYPDLEAMWTSRVLGWYSQSILSAGKFT